MESWRLTISVLGWPIVVRLVISFAVASDCSESHAFSGLIIAY